MVRELEIVRMGGSGREGMARKMEKMKAELRAAADKEEALRRNCQEQQFDLYVKDKQLRRNEALRSPSIDPHSPDSNIRTENN